eukprot:436783-Amphidinium_carterae.1
MTQACDYGCCQTCLWDDLGCLVHELSSSTDAWDARALRNEAIAQARTRTRNCYLWAEVFANHDCQCITSLRPPRSLAMLTQTQTTRRSEGMVTAPLSITTRMQHIP